MKHFLSLAIIILVMVGACGCKGRQAHSWPRTYAMTAANDYAADSVVRAADNRDFQISDSTKIIVLSGETAFSGSDDMTDKVFNHFMRGGAVVVTSPKSGEWLHLWRRFELRYNRMKASGKLPAGFSADAVRGIENMVAEMVDVAGMDGTEKNMNFEYPIARLIGFRGSDVYYQVICVNLDKLLKWESGTPATDASLSEQY